MNLEYRARSFGGAVVQMTPLWLALAIARGDLTLEIGVPAALVLGAFVTLVSRWASLKISGHSRTCSECGHMHRVCDCEAYAEQY